MVGSNVLLVVDVALVMTPDQINGALEFGSALLMLMNVRRLTKDKVLAGVSLIPTLFFDSWGFWNLYYYPALDQWWSFSGGACLVLVNLTWTGLAFYYGGIFGKIKGRISAFFSRAQVAYSRSKGTA